ncbi:Chitin binding protein [Methanosarcina siciliae T4/M]|uniref:Chitin binding protein n=1 Tax=Methanosarcina siciliae T4/M TaxID=1434120 RepID=A0A0E3P5W7_9EURY|nr:leucine-rich repeat protein [Methanosarcina siciliae]AKB29104.1 Chitin binding protein [Methanosarcina siciliae T4/M]
MNKNTLKIFLICVTLLLVAAAQPVLGSDWFTFQNDNYNSGITDEAGPIGNNGDYAFAVLTSSSGMAGIDTTPVVAGDVVYTAAMGKAFAFNKTTGDEIWNTSLSGGFVLSTPVIADGKIFIGTNNGVIAAYDISNGTRAWINSTGLGGDKAQVNTPIVYDEGNIYFGTWFASGTGSYYCVNATNGSFVWELACTSSAGYYWSGACVVGDYLVYGGDDGHLVSVNKYTGAAAEDVSTSMIFDSGTGNIRSSLSYDQSTGRLYFAAGSTCYYVGFNPGTGAFVKTVKGTGTMTGDSTSTPAVYNDRVYVGCGGSLYCLDADSLQIIWSYAAGGQVQSSPAISTYYDDGDGEIYIYFTTNDYSSGMYCLKDMPGNTEPIEQFTFFPPSSMKQYSLQGAAISDGMVYYGNDAGYMFGLEDPDICFAANTTYGSAPLTVQFTDKSAGATEWQWDFDNDGNVDSTEQNPVYTYNVTGNYSVNLTITKSTGSVQELKTDYITVIDATPLEDYLLYTNSSTSVTITGYTGPAGDLVIPSEIDGLPVTAIAKNALSGSPLTSVVIPDSVTSMGAGAFNNCDDLTSIDMGGITYITNNGLRNCPSLETLTLGSGFNMIYGYGIRDCPSLNAMIFEGNAPGLSGTWNYNAPNIVMYYYENATGFSTPTMSGKPCYPVGSPTADFSTHGVSGGSAPLTVQYTYTGVGANALSWYFDDDATVDSTARNPSYTYDTPGTYAVSLYVSNPWGSDSVLRTDYITVTEGRADGWAYTSDGTSVTITGYSGPDSNMTIPGEIDGLPVTTIGDSACKGLTSLTSVVIPDNVTTIDDSAFYGCTALTTMIFNGNAPTTVGSSWASGTNLVAYYYEGATGFTTPTWNGVPCYPVGVPTADFTSSAVYGTAPLTLTFTYTSVGANALAWDYNNNGTVDSTEREPSNTYDTVGTYSVSLNVSNPWGNDSEVKTAYITVVEPVGNFTYTSDGTSVTITGYSGPGGDVVIPDTIVGLPVTVIGGSVFKNVALTSVVIPDSVTTIGDSAFYGCSGLTSVPIGNNVTSIGGSAFYKCSGLTSVVIPDSVTSIGGSAFYECNGLTSVVIPSIGGSAFYQCSGLTSVTIGNNVTSLGERTFYRCRALTSVTIGNSVTSIGDYAFQNVAFTSVVIPDSVTSIGVRAFRGCSGLTSVTIGNNLTSIGNVAFEGCSALTSMVFTGNAPTTVSSNWASNSPNIVAYYYEDATGFTTPTWKSVACYPLTAAPVADFEANVTSGIRPLIVNFTDLSTRSPETWEWDFNNDGTVDSTEQNPSYTYTSAGTYTVNLTVANANGTDSEVKIDYITVSESSTPEEPVSAFTADVTGGIAPLTVNFTDQSTGSPTSWAWDFENDGTVDSTEQNPVHTYSAAGNYTVNLTVENEAGSDFELKSDYIEISEASGSTVTLYFDPASSSVSENESTEINLVASNFPAGLSGYNLTVAIDDPAVAEIVNIEYPTWALITENSTLPGTSIYMKTVDLEDAIQEGAANVVLATLTVSGKKKGSANLSIGAKRLEEDSGDSIEPALLTGTIEVTLLSPLPDQEYAPRDLDGDGLYEDLTGNGEFSFVDIVAYFHNMDWIEENMPVEYFDFNGNGRIDFDDVVDMFAMI